jgi:hypothetical protein
MSGQFLLRLRVSPRFPARRAGNRPMVEAGGQLIRGFRHGLDYAFIRAPGGGCGACYPADQALPDPSVRPRRARAVGGSMSLYRAGLKLAFFLPLGVAMPPARAASGFADVSSVLIRTSRSGATH